MAFSGVSAGGFTASKTANQSSASRTINQNASVGDFLVAIAVVDNNGSTNGDFGAVTSVTDAAGNTYQKAVEFQNAGNATQGGVVVSIWFSNLTFAMTANTTTITWNFSNNTSRDASVVGSIKLLKDTTKNATVVGTATEAIATNPGSLNVTGENIEHFRLRVVGLESATTTALTGTTNWTVLTGAQTSGSSDNSNVGIRMEYRIVTGTNSASDPNNAYNVDMASCYVAWKETTPSTARRLGLLGVG